MECKNKSDTINNRGNWNRLRIIQNISGKHNTRELLKTALLGTVQILHNVLRYKYKTFIMGNNITCNTDCNHRTAAKLYALEIWGFFRHIIINTRYKDHIIIIINMFQLHALITHISFLGSERQKILPMYEGWNFNSGNYLFTTDTK